MEETDVLVVGAGPVGAALAIELGGRGVRCAVIERRTQRSPQPRAKLTNVRTMGLMRRWGLARRMRSASSLPPDFPSDIAFVTRLCGWELTRFPDALSTAVVRTRPYPEPAQQVPQDILEQVLRDHARTLPSVRISPGVTLDGFEQDAGGVTATLRDVDTGETSTLRARYLAGCDGGRSTVRNLLDIGMPGVDLAPNVSAVFRAPALWSRHDKAPGVHYWATTPDAPSILGPLNPSDLWWYHLNEAPQGGRMSDDEIRQSFYAAVGDDGFDCEVVANGPWIAERRLADRYRDGRVLLLGDAAHLHPPMGGYGMNMGIGDAVDAGWKLAAVVQGWGGDVLLDSYELERRPVHRRVIDEASANYANNSNRYMSRDIEDPGEAGDRLRAQVGATIHEQKSREFASLGVQLGYRYEDSPIIVGDGSDPTPDQVGAYVPTARPGHLAPHAWLDDERCLYDRLGPAMTLLRLGAGEAAADAFVRVAARQGVPLHVVELTDPALRALYGADLVLVRPDQHVAWRGGDAGDAANVLARVTGRMPDANAARRLRGAQAASAARSSAPS